MEILTKETIQELLSVGQAPCLSLYMPTHRSHPDNLQDVIRFRNLVKQMEESISQTGLAAIFRYNNINNT